MELLKSNLLIASQCQLGEGPVWIDHLLWWVDIDGKKLHSWNALNKKIDSYDMPEQIGFAVPTTQSEWMIGLKTGIYLWNPISHHLNRIHNPEPDLPKNRFNDGKADPQGRVWAGTLGPTGEASLYRMIGKQSHDKMLSNITISNGLAWDEKKARMYYIDSPTQRIEQFDFDSASGTISHQKTILTVPRDMGTPDGMSIDTEGNLWVALWDGFGVICVHPDTGNILAKVEVPTSRITSCCFGGDSLKTLFITSAANDDDAASGNVYTTELNVSGRPLTLAKL